MKLRSTWWCQGKFTEYHGVALFGGSLNRSSNVSMRVLFSTGLLTGIKA